MFIEKLLLLISFTIPVFIPLLMWPSKKNFVFVQLFPFYLIAYVGGILFLFNYSVLIHHIPISNIFYLSYVMIIGAFFYALSFYLTYTSKVSWKNITEKKLEYYIQKAQNPDLWPRIERKLKFAVLILSIIAIVFFIYSYIKMGFVPHLRSWLESKLRSTTCKLRLENRSHSVHAVMPRTRPGRCCFLEITSKSFLNIR